MFPLTPRATAVPAPFSFSADQDFLGNDGLWSTFSIQVGTPAQTFHVLPSTSSQETWLPAVEGCTAADGSKCGAQRGVGVFRGVASSGFDPTQSSTWTAINLFGLDTEDRLDPYYQANGSYGLDTVTLGAPNTISLTLSGQKSIVAGMAAKSFYLGMIGLSPKPTNFSTADTPSPSLLTLLKNGSLIPSLSYAYTAGQHYATSTGQLASLTLGGYDASRFIPSSAAIFPFASDDTYPLTIGLQAITVSRTLNGGTVQLLDQGGIFTVIDSTVPEIWLPNSTCDRLAVALGLTYDTRTDRYIVNATTHASLSSLKPVFEFSLGVDRVGVSSTSIALPYAALDLNASYNIFNTSTSYFPIRRSANEKQYTLGRTFLQEAYLIANYETNNFTIARVNTTAGTPYVVPILTQSALVPASSAMSLSIGAIIGIVIGCLVFLGFIGGTVFVLRRHRRRRAARYSTATTVYDGPLHEHDGPLHEHYGNDAKLMDFVEPSEMSPEEIRAEMPSPDMRTEMPTPDLIEKGEAQRRFEMESPKSKHAVSRAEHRFELE